jgi:hypothetical protein
MQVAPPLFYPCKGLTGFEITYINPGELEAPALCCTSLACTEGKIERFDLHCIVGELRDLYQFHLGLAYNM